MIHKIISNNKYGNFLNNYLFYKIFQKKHIYIIIHIISNKL